MLDTIKGEIKIFTKEVERADCSKPKRVIFNACVGYSTIGEGEDKEYLNYYMPVNFATALRKDVAKVYTKESFDVLIKEAWIKAYKDKDGNTKPILFVNKATIVSEDKPKAKAKKAKAEVESIVDDSLPF